MQHNRQADQVVTKWEENGDDDSYKHLNCTANAFDEIIAQQQLDPENQSHILPESWSDNDLSDLQGYKLLACFAQQHKKFPSST